MDAYVESGDVGVSLKAGLISGTSAYFAHEIGTWFKDGWAANAFTSPTLANVVKATFHGVRGGIAAELSGGKFGAGAGAAFFGDYAGGLAHEYTGGEVGSGLIVSAIVGGTASEIGGGKFSNGALSGAMTFLLNTASHRDSGQKGQGEREIDDLDKYVFAVADKAMELPGTREKYWLVVELTDVETGEITYINSTVNAQPKSVTSADERRAWDKFGYRIKNRIWDGTARLVARGHTHPSTAGASSKDVERAIRGIKLGVRDYLRTSNGNIYQIMGTKPYSKLDLFLENLWLPRNFDKYQRLLRKGN